MSPGNLTIGAAALLIHQATDDLTASAIVSGILGIAAVSLHRRPATR